MTTANGAEVAPYSEQALTGRVIAPPAHPDSHNVHKAVQVFHEIVAESRAFKNEQDVLDAHDALRAFERVLIPAVDHQRVVKETDRAPVEDVRLRVPTAMPIVPGAAPIDYNALAEAIVAVQRRQAAADAAAATAEPPVQQAVRTTPQPEVPVITDAV